MEIIEIATGIKKTVVIKEAEVKDFRVLIKKRFSFTWKTFQNTTTVYKLQIENEGDILGVVGLIDWPEEKRIEIKLLASSVENIGKEKIYEGIAGCLIASACRSSVEKYGADACVSLVPKTELIKHYMQKYHMQHAGWQLYLEGKQLYKLLKEYFL
jgi:hypothetical protein